MDISQTDRVTQHEIKYVQGKQEQEIKHEMHKMEKKYRVKCQNIKHDAEKDKSNG